MSVLYRKHNYTNKNIELIRDVKIREYDIKSAGLNILLNKGYVGEDEYKYLMSIDKLSRNVIIGKWLRENKEVNAVMMDEFIRIRKIFFELNDIQDDEVLSIKKDAIFLIDRIATVLEFENYKFVCKEEYTDFLLMDKKEYYYNKYNDELEVKGFSKESKEFQKDYYFKLIRELLKFNKDKKAIFRKLIVFKDDFLNKELPKEYYKVIEGSKYPFKIGGILKYMDNIPDELLCKVDINSNLHFINNLINIFI